MEAGLLDCMTTPAQGNVIPDGCSWAADNGRFGKGWPGAAAWWTWLQGQVERYDGANRCLWALAPDVPFDAVGTLAESLPWLSRIRSLGVPAAFAAQDGCENGLIPWGEFDVLFIAGSTEWKIGDAAEALCVEARARGVRIHMGRVNSLKRLRRAEEFGCDTADGTFLAFGPDLNLKRLSGWLDAIEHEHQPSLFTALEPSA
jgi:hypothetical protein